MLAEYIRKNNIKILIDLHGCWSFRDFLIELGTWWDWNPHLLWRLDVLNIIEKSLNESLKTYIQHSKQKITKNTIFQASRDTTVSSFIFNECKIQTIQIEINKDLRDLNNPKNVSLLINALETMLNDIKIFI